MAGRVLVFQRTDSSLPSPALHARRHMIDPDLQDAVRAIVDALQVLVLLRPRAVFLVARLARQLARMRFKPPRSA